MKYEAVIGLEVHVQLQTQSKIFSSAPIAYGAEPNTQANAVDLAMPGTLPVLNEKVLEMAIKLGLAIDATVAKHSVFARKNYFYPDLPKGYQISQYDQPIVQGGHLTINLEDGSTKRIAITRAHLEEDAGKSLHENFKDSTGIDYNRAGTPLLEVVSEPELRSAAEAVAYLKTLHTLVRHLQICDGNMQEGSFRCDANVSVRPVGQTEFGTRAEVKNVNSFRFVERAINYEIDRQIQLIEDGGTVVQETRLYDPDRDQTRAMRSKEEADDYRYFPDPDLLPITITEATINAIAANLPELPQAKAKRLQSEYQLSASDAAFLVQSPAVATYFETLTAANVSAKLATNWLMGEVAAGLNKADLTIEHCPIDATRLAGLLQRIEDQTISGKIAKTVFEHMWNSSQSADDVINEQGLQQVTDTSAIEKVVDQIIEANPEQVAQFKAGKTKMLGFFVGQVMKAMQGKASPQQVNDLLKQKLNA